MVARECRAVEYNQAMARRQRARLGQVFLADPRVERRILAALQLKPTDVILEIGAGPGNMTELLAETAAQVIAVELDPKWAERLRERFAAGGRVAVLESDILQLPLDEVARRAGRKRLKIFGNLPYYITSPILMHLFQHALVIEDAVIMVQREVAERLVARPGSKNYGLLSVSCQYYSRPELLFVIPPRAFRRPPKVESALVRLTIAPQGEALGIKDEGAFWRWLRAAFAHKRKTLANNVKHLCNPAHLRAAMQQHGINPRTRAETLSLPQLAALYRDCFSPA